MVEEFWIWGSKGKGLPVPTPAEKTPNHFSERVVRQRGMHSRKPDKLYDDLARQYPGVAKLEMFAREPREGWDTHGNGPGFWTVAACGLAVAWFSRRSSAARQLRCAALPAHARAPSPTPRALRPSKGEKFAVGDHAAGARGWVGDDVAPPRRESLKGDNGDALTGQDMEGRGGNIAHRGSVLSVGFGSL
jgi:hypothetical protein